VYTRAIAAPNEVDVTPTQIALVKSSWTQVRPLEAQVADRFYDRLFVLDPSLRGLFPENLSKQKVKLMDMLGRIVASLSTPELLVPAARELGRRHAGYAVQPAHYDTVGRALVWALERSLGHEFTSEVRQAWMAAYAMLSRTMIDAAEPQA
jgi:methyl-accepting chemotaxis protein